MAQTLESQIWKVSAGESIEATMGYSDYPADDGWACSVTVMGLGFTTTTACTTSETSFVLAITAATTATWKPGPAAATVTVAKGASTKRPEKFCFNVTADPTVLTDEQTILAAINSLVSGVAIDDQLTTQLDGIGLTYPMRQNIDKLLEFQARYKRIVDVQIRQAGGKGGVYAIQHIYGCASVPGSPWYGGYPPRVR